MEEIRTVKQLRGDSVMVNGTIGCSIYHEAVQEWLANGGEIEPEFSFEDIKEILIREVKEAAGRKITERLPEWKQRNLLARALQLSTIDRTESEQAELDRINDEWAWVQMVRENSNIIENNIIEMSQEEYESGSVQVRLSDIYNTGSPATDA